MQTTTFDIPPARNAPAASDIATEARGSAKLRKVLFGAGLAVVPGVVATAVGMLARSRRAGVIAGGAAAAALGAYRWQLQRSFKNEPDYVVEDRIGDFEIRRYDARVEAQTILAEDDFHRALDDGFERLAAYITGANERREKLGMTTPVTARFVDDGDHVIAFVMPVNRTLASLPAPDDDRIELVEVPPRRVAVLKFRGRRSGVLVADKAAELRRFALAEGYTVARRPPVYAGFDPPWTLPLLRRNEIWLELTEA